MQLQKLNRVLTVLAPLWSHACGGRITLDKLDDTSALVHDLTVSGTIYGHIFATFDPAYEHTAHILFESWTCLLEMLLESYITAGQLTDELMLAWDRLHFLNEISSVVGDNSTLWDACLAALRLAAEVTGSTNGFIAQGEPPQFLWLHPDADSTFTAALMTMLQTAEGEVTHRPIQDGRDFIGTRISHQVFAGLIHTPDTAFNAGDIQVFISLSEQLRRLIQIERLHHEQREAQALNHDFELAGQVQLNTLPAQLPTLPGFDFAAALLPASRVSGDFYDIVTVQDALHVMICDVAGKGISGALVAAGVRGVLRSHLGRTVEPGRVLAEANRLLYDDMTRSEKFTTAMLVSSHPQSPSWCYANAGHTTAFHLCSDPLRVETLPSRTPPLGILPEVDATSYNVEMAENDVLVLYSDGLTEMTNNANRLLGMGTVIHALLATHTAPAQFILDSLVQIYHEHRGEKPIEDDLTLVVIKKVQADTSSVRHFARWEFPAQLNVAWRVEAELNTLRVFLPRTEAANVWLIEVQLALTELFNNVVIHAYQGQKGYIHGLLEVRGDHLRIELIDYGVTYKEEPLAPLDLDSLPESGYGMHLIHQIMDEVRYERLENGFNRWTLIRALPAHGEIK